MKRAELALVNLGYRTMLVIRVLAYAGLALAAIALLALFAASFVAR